MGICICVLNMFRSGEKCLSLSVFGSYLYVSGENDYNNEANLKAADHSKFEGVSINN